MLDSELHCRRGCLRNQACVAAKDLKRQRNAEVLKRSDFRFDDMLGGRLLTHPQKLRDREIGAARAHERFAHRRVRDSLHRGKYEFGDETDRPRHGHLSRSHYINNRYYS